MANWCSSQRAGSSGASRKATRPTGSAFRRGANRSRWCGNSGGRLLTTCFPVKFPVLNSRFHEIDMSKLSTAKRQPEMRLDENDGGMDARRRDNFDYLSPL